MMRLPTQMPSVPRGHRSSRFPESVHPSGCNVFKKIACAGALAACATVCVGSGGALCAQCLAGIGAAGCIDCI